MDIVEFQGIFEYELKRKLAQRSRSPQEELRKLISAFKFFDYTSSFLLDKNQWIKGILRTGLCGFNVNDLSNVFQRYDPNKTGYINYINFSNYLYGKEEFSPISSDFENNKISNENNIVNNSRITNEFKPPGLYERNIDINMKNNQLSHYNNSESSQNDFNLNNNNSNANTNINTNNIESNVLKQKNYHMTKSQSQILSQNKNNIIDINNNEINNQNNLINNNNIQNIQNNQNNSNPESKNYFEKLINIFKNKINTNNGITYYTFVHALKSLEDKQSHSISIESLLSIIEQMQLNISQDDLINFYSILDYTQSNKVSTDEIIRIIKGEIPEKRKILIVSKFALMDKEKTGVIPINLVKSVYNSKFHPDSFLGKKSQEDVYKEFLYTFDIFCEINGLKEDISYKHFIDYYTPISASILSDNYFDDIIYGVWNIENKANETNNNNNINLTENKIIENNNYNGNDVQMDKANNFQINNLSKSQNIVMDKNNRMFSPNRQAGNIKKQKMTPYYNPRASPEGKGLKMFRQLRFNPLINEYIMSPVPPETNTNKIDNQIYNNININDSTNINNNIDNMNNSNKINSNGLQKIDLLRDLLIKRGQKSIFIIQRMFYIYDRNQTGEIPFEKLCDIFEIYNMSLTKEDIFEIFNILDKGHTGIIKYNDLIQILINNINEKREIIIQKLFEKLHKGNGYVLINDLKKSFNATKHPDVINQIRNKDEIFLDFFDSLEIFKEYNGNLNNDNIKNGYMSYEDFSNFFKEISMSIIDDTFFEYYINNCWGSNINMESNTNYNNNYGYSGNNNVRIRTGKQIMNNF